MAEQKSAKDGDKKITRRDFLDWIIKGGLFATLAGFVLPALAYLWPITQSGPSRAPQDVGALDEIPVGGAKKVVIDGHAVLIIRTPQGVKALSAICTHLGCIVEWSQHEQKVVCPCHAGYFDIEGRVLSGPPPTPLSLYQVRVAGDRIFVRL